MSKKRKTKVGDLLDSYKEYCPLCGQEMDEEWDEYSSSYTCTCKDYIHNRDIRNKIYELESKLIQDKYEVENVPMLKRIHR